MIHLDTHVVVWLYAGLVDRFSQAALDRIERSSLLISPMVALELQYLFEIERISEPAPVVLKDLQERIGLRKSKATFGTVVERACQLTWTRDPFDRLIAAQAIVEDLPLLTADRVLLENLDRAVWD